MRMKISVIVPAFNEEKFIARALRKIKAATGDWLVFVDADSYPSRELFADLASVIQSGRCLGGGAVVAMDRAIGWTGVFIHVWNAISRIKHWAAGSFVFCEACVFRELGGFSQEPYAADYLEFSERSQTLAPA